MLVGEAKHMSDLVKGCVYTTSPAVCSEIPAEVHSAVRHANRQVVATNIRPCTIALEEADADHRIFDILYLLELETDPYISPAFKCLFNEWNVVLRISIWTFPSVIVVKNLGVVGPFLFDLSDKHCTAGTFDFFGQNGFLHVGHRTHQGCAMVVIMWGGVHLSW